MVGMPQHTSNGGDTIRKIKKKCFFHFGIIPGKRGDVGMHLRKSWDQITPGAVNNRGFSWIQGGVCFQNPLDGGGVHHNMALTDLSVPDIYNVDIGKDKCIILNLMLSAGRLAGNNYG